MIMLCFDFNTNGESSLSEMVYKVLEIFLHYNFTYQFVKVARRAIL